MSTDSAGDDERFAPWRALVAILLNRRAFVEMHVAYMVELNQDDTWREIIADPVRAAPHLREWSENGDRGCSAIRGRVYRSLAFTVGVGVLAVIAASVTGAVGLGLPPSFPKIVLFAGSFLMAWATVIGLGTSSTYWDGPPLHEQVIPVAFLIIFLPGAFLALLSGLL